MNSKENTIQTHLQNTLIALTNELNESQKLLKSLSEKKKFVKHHQTRIHINNMQNMSLLDFHKLLAVDEKHLDCTKFIITFNKDGHHQISAYTEIEETDEQFKARIKGLPHISQIEQKINLLSNSIADLDLLLHSYGLEPKSSNQAQQDQPKPSALYIQFHPYNKK